MVVTEIIKVVQRSERKLTIANSGNTLSVNQTRKRLITKLKSPKVIICKGKVIRPRIGLMKNDKNPKKAPTKIKL